MIIWGLVAVAIALVALELACNAIERDRGNQIDRLITKRARGRRALRRGAW